MNNTRVAASFESFRCYHILEFLVELDDGSTVFQPTLLENELMRLLRALQVCHYSESISLEEQLGAFVNTTNASSIDVVACYGRQHVVVHELKQREWYPETLEKYLMDEHEGIYAIFLHDENDGPRIVLFSWLTDDAFLPKFIRGRATYALRFLTTLTSSVIVCLNEFDLAQLTPSDSNRQEDEVGQDYTLEFEIESAAVEEESVVCKYTKCKKINVKQLQGSANSDTIIGTTFSEDKKIVVKVQSLVNATDQVNWILNIMETHIFDMKCQIPIKVMTEVLKVWDILPVARLEENTQQFYHKQQKDQSYAHIKERLDNLKLRLTQSASNLFYLSNDKGEVKADKSFKKSLEILGKIFGPREDYIITTLDFRSQIRMAILNKYKELMSPNDAGYWGFFKSLLPSSGDFKFPFCHQQEIFQELYPHLFNYLEAAFAEWQIKLTQVIESTENINEAIQHHIKNNPEKYKKVKVTTFREKREEIIFETFCNSIISRNLSKPFNTMSAYVNYGKAGKLDFSSQQIDGGNIKIQLDNFGLNDDSHDSYNVSVPLESKIIHLSIVGNTTLILVYLDNNKTVVQALQAIPKRPAIVLQSKSYPKTITLCDFDPSKRMLAMLHSEHSIELFAFNESYKALEHKKSYSIAAMDMQQPITNLIIFNGDENGLIVTDCNCNAKTFNFRSRRTTQLPNDIMTEQSLMVKVHGGIFVMFLSPSEDGSKIIMKTLISQKHLMLPMTEVSLPHGIKWSNAQAQAYGDYLVLFDVVSKCVAIFELKITTGSVAWNLKSTQSADTCESEESHLLWSFFHCFEKFPVRSLMEDVSKDRLLQNQLSLHIRLANPDTKASLSGMLRAIMTKLKDQNKPLYNLDLAEQLITYAEISKDIDVWARVVLNKWILELMGFVPVPICRASDDHLNLLRHGVSANYDGKDASEIAKQIDFGPISQILQGWTGPVVVITSMGKQSTGKSYFLNHLTGSSFASSGARCTDGVWITIRALDNCLVVVLDFEGLGSFERTAQEDMLLSILNAAVSRLTVFRIEMRFDKDIDTMFSKFQQGVALLKGDPRLFQGKLYLNAKDVNPNDRKSVIDEFQGKLQRILTENRSDNFVSAMYGGKVIITCAPPLGSTGYYEALKEAFRAFDAARKEKTYKNGMDFYECLALILAKISVLDWTDMESHVKEQRVLTLRNAVYTALRNGQLLEGDDPEFNGVDQNITSQYFHFMQTNDGEDQLPKDSELDFYLDLNQLETSNELVKAALLNFATAYFQITDIKRSQKMEKKFDALLEFIVWRREYRIRKWFGTLTDVTSDARDNLDSSITMFKQLFRRCQQTCTQCQLGCFESLLHKSNHDCGTNHECDGVCYYCEEKPVCGMTAGHEGHCNCKKKPHTCSMTCELIGASNCQKVCQLDYGHDGPHICSVKVHCCGQKCEATNCKGSCTERFDLPHDQHTCGAGRCQQICTHDGCNNTCMSDDHFHPEHAAHDCNIEHRCQCDCAVDGVCELKVQLEETTETFQGKRSTFTYKSKVMTRLHKKCATKLGVGCFDHNGTKHACDTNIHYCDEQCPCCGYYCEKEFGHNGLHKTSHGNMKHAFFVSDTNAFDIDDKKYEAGEVGVAEMCPYFCTQMGRGHVHYLPCSHSSAESCVNGCDGQRHCTTELIPKPNTPMDELLHDAYFKAIGWDDPVTNSSEREEFGLCPYRCCADDHEDDKKISYCILDAWHPPMRSTDPEANKYGHSVVQGHLFPCHHQTSSGMKHHVFVLDSSGSMSGDPWTNLMDAVHTYLRDQIENNGHDDIVTIITFSGKGTLVHQGVSMDSALTASIPFDGGWTEFKEGLILAQQVFSRNDHNKYLPVLLFFTDGETSGRDESMACAKEIGNEFNCFGLKSYFIGFGRINHGFLETMATEIGGSCLKAVSRIELIDTFKEIAVSVQARTGLFAGNAVAA
ncbi:hypothetical protein THRCLA_01913 [Thraustotheca clavata]|uniref:VWFA domain-containing protein n=1 Tax=Thraustotheca clavata TaxID=74557 RepID=A0A1W0A741_9STRA|nr:hypothetical protein THRCLA_01913 [Thraustotheca clavata]